MTSHSPTFSLRRAALAVTTFTVAFSTGEVVSAGQPTTPANDEAPSTLQAFERHATVEFAPAFDPYADPTIRMGRQARELESLAPAARLTEASAMGYVVQLGGFPAAPLAPLRTQPQEPLGAARLGPINTRL